jgi:hypothetical protein
MVTSTHVPLPSTVEQYPGFKLVRLAGDAYDRGRLHGELLRDGIHELRSIFFDQIVYRMGLVTGLAFESVMLPILQVMHRHIPGELRAEMSGVADGAGVRYRDVVLFNCFDDLLHTLWLIQPIVAKLPFGGRFACSAFTLLGERTASGRALLGRNLDYEIVNGFMAAAGVVTRALRENLIVFDVQPSAGLSFMSVAWPGYVGVVTGFNQAGLAISCLTSPIPGETPNGMPLPLLYRRIAQYASTLAETDVLLHRTPRTIGNNVMVVSAAERCARAYEITPTLVAHRSPHNGYLVATNHFEHPAAAAIQGSWRVQSSVDRTIRLTSLCSETGAADETTSRFLEDTVCLSEDLGTWGCVENSGTVYSSLVEPESGRFWLRTRDTRDRPFVEVRPAWEVTAERSVVYNASEARNGASGNPGGETARSQSLTPT